MFSGNNKLARVNENRNARPDIGAREIREYPRDNYFHQLLYRLAGETR